MCMPIKQRRKWEIDKKSSNIVLTRHKGLRTSEKSCSGSASFHINMWSRLCFLCIPSKGPSDSRVLSLTISKKHQSHSMKCQ